MMKSRNHQKKIFLAIALLGCAYSYTTGPHGANARIAEAQEDTVSGVTIIREQAENTATSTGNNELDPPFITDIDDIDTDTDSIDTNASTTATSTEDTSASTSTSTPVPATANPNTPTTPNTPIPAAPVTPDEPATPAVQAEPEPEPESEPATATQPKPATATEPASLVIEAEDVPDQPLSYDLLLKGTYAGSNLYARDALTPEATRIYLMNAIAAAIFGLILSSEGLRRTFFNFGNRYSQPFMGRYARGNVKKETYESQHN